MAHGIPVYTVSMDGSIVPVSVCVHVCARVCVCVMQRLHVRMIEVVNEASGCGSTNYPINAWVDSQTGEAQYYYGSLETYKLTLHTSKTKGGLPAGAQLYMSLVQKGEARTMA